VADKKQIDMAKRAIPWFDEGDFIKKIGLKGWLKMGLELK
jgi:hypothetical protein